MTPDVPFCDHLTVTSPDDGPDVSDAVVSVLLDAGAHEKNVGEWEVGSGSVWVKKRYGVQVVSATGAALFRLRAASLFQNYLWALASVPHRVTRLDASMDVVVDAPPVLKRLTARALRGGVQFTRKKLDVKRDVSWHSAVSLVEGDTRKTGTLYLGAKSADVRVAVYDKRQERLAKGELFDPGPWLRYEIRCGRGLGVSLRDAAEPVSLFWHFAGDALLPKLRGVADWAPHDGGYELPAPKPPDYYRQLELLLEKSPDVRRLVGLADKLGPYGRDLLARKVKALPAERPDDAPPPPLAALQPA